MFLCFTKFYKWYIQDFGKIAASLISMLKRIAWSILAEPAYSAANENELPMDSIDSISGGKIEDKIANLSNTTKKMNFGADFLVIKACLAFI